MPEKLDLSCPKCGHAETEAIFYPPGKRVRSIQARVCEEFCDEFIPGSISITAVGTIDTGCISVHCDRCQYDWAVKALS